jgi:hypothetical protein
MTIRADYAATTVDITVPSTSSRDRGWTETAGAIFDMTATFPTSSVTKIAFLRERPTAEQTRPITDEEWATVQEVLATEARQKEVQKQIDEKLQVAYAAIREAQRIADKENVSFRFDLAYGMGGTYMPEGDEGRDGENDDNGWAASSRGC